MASLGNLTLSYLRLQPLPRRRFRPIVACFPGYPSVEGTGSIKPRTLEARDVKITFGRHNGERLGTLPPSYVTWLSALSDPHWSYLAKLVLADPVYQDRIEWEPARRLFSGEDAKGNFIWDWDFDVMKAYREIGESHGWDMDDKEGWSKVTRDLIGTSFSGRIPRKNGKRSQLGASESVKCEESMMKKESLVGVKSKMKKESLVGGKRGERIARMRLKREKVPAKIEDKGVVNDREELGYLDNQNGVEKGKNSGVLVGGTLGFVDNQNDVEKGKNSGGLVGRTLGFVDNQNGVEKGKNSGVLVGRTLGFVDNQNGVQKSRSSGFLVGRKWGEVKDRIRIKRERNVQMVKTDKAKEEILEEKGKKTPTIEIKKGRTRRKGDLNKGNRELGVGRIDEMISFAKREQNSEDEEIFNPFPGRDGLLKKLMMIKKKDN